MSKSYMNLITIICLAFAMGNLRPTWGESTAWQTYKSDDWGFSVKFPGIMRSKKQSDGSEKFMSVSDSDTYIVKAERRIANNKSDKQALADFAGKATAKTSSKLSKSAAEMTLQAKFIKDISEPGLLCKDFTVQTTFKRQAQQQPVYKLALNYVQNGYCRICMSKRAFYMLIVMPLNPEIHYCSTANAAKFFKSFIIVDPN